MDIATAKPFKRLARRMRILRCARGAPTREACINSCQRFDWLLIKVRVICAGFGERARRDRCKTAMRRELEFHQALKHVYPG